MSGSDNAQGMAVVTYSLGAVVPEAGRVLGSSFFDPIPRAAALVWDKLRGTSTYSDHCLDASGVPPLRRLTDLAANKQAGLRFLSGGIVQSTLDWDYRLCLARGHGPDMLEQELTAWKGVVGGLVEDGEKSAAADTFYDALLNTHENRVKRARQLLAVPPGSNLNAEQSRLLDRLVSGDEAGVMALAPKAFSSLMGDTVPWWEQVVAPVMAVVGQLWECGAISVGQQHIASYIIDQAVHEQRVLSPAPAADAPTVMVLLPEREEHSLGAAMAAVILRNFGLRPLVTRAEGPGGDWLVEFAVSQRTEAVIVVATLPSTLTQLERVISKFRDLLGDTCPQMITAGPAFSADPSLLAHSTADAHLSSLQALARWAEAPV